MIGIIISENVDNYGRPLTSAVSMLSLGPSFVVLCRNDAQINDTCTLQIAWKIHTPLNSQHGVYKFTEARMAHIKFHVGCQEPLEV